MGSNKLKLKELTLEEIKKNPNGVIVAIGKNESKAFQIRKIMEEINKKKSKAN